MDFERIDRPERVELLVLEGPTPTPSNLFTRPPGGDHNYVFVRGEQESARHFALRVLHRTRHALRGRRELTKLTCVLDVVPTPPAVRTRFLSALLSALSRKGVCRLLGHGNETGGVFECMDALSPLLRPGAGLEVRVLGDVSESPAPSHRFR